MTSDQEFQDLRAFLETRQDGPLMIVVSSGAEGDGKTDLACGLARAFADCGTSTLLLDANDLRPAAARRLGLGSGVSLRDADLDPAAFEPMIAEGGVAVAAFDDPGLARRISIARLRTFCTGLRERYDAIIVDAGGIAESPLALQLATVSDGLVLAFRFGRKVVAGDRVLVDRVTAARVPIVGVVPTGVRELSPAWDGGAVLDRLWQALKRIAGAVKLPRLAGAPRPALPAGRPAPRRPVVSLSAVPAPTVKALPAATPAVPPVAAPAPPAAVARLRPAPPVAKKPAPIFWNAGSRKKAPGLLAAKTLEMRRKARPAVILPKTRTSAMR